MDAIHTRIGAADDLANAQSTFMLEMTEAAQILHAATPASLVLMDEIGRGTSTFDGLALASGIAAHLHDKTQAYTLFATHYFELTEFPAKHHAAVNVHVSAAESGADIVFLHEIQPGPASRSYGIQVARLAGMPAGVVNHARHALNALETQQTLSREQVDLFAPPPAAEAPTHSAVEAAVAALNPGRAEPARGAGPLYQLKKLRRETDMTYCVGIKLNAGLVFLTDSRTNAGVDHISTFRKMIVYERPGDRFMVLLSAGNLSISQSVREILQVEQLKEGPESEAAHHLERQEHVRRGAGSGQRRAACVRPRRRRAEVRRRRVQRLADLRRPDPR